MQKLIPSTPTEKRTSGPTVLGTMAVSVRSCAVEG